MSAATMLPVEQLRAVVEMASLAPSVHNTQPWLFHWDGAVLELREDPSRGLPTLDPTGRERVLSCGAALLHARLALRELGHGEVTTLLPDPDEPALLARIEVGGPAAPTPVEHELALAVPLRATERDRFDERAVPARALASLAAAADAEGAWLRVLEGEDAIEVQVLLSHADAAQRSDPAYLAELAAWRVDGDDGVPTRATSPVPVTQRGSSWVMRDFDATPAPAASHEPPPAEHPCVVVLGTPGDGPASWLVAGQALARVLLRATADGLACQPLTQVLEVPVLRARMRTVLGVLGQPQMLLRVGYGHTGPTSHRRPVEDVLTVT